MKRTKLIHVFAGLMFASSFTGPALAQVKKCTLPDGTVRYSDMPCSEKESVKNLSVPSTQIKPSEPKVQSLQRLSPEAQKHEAERVKARERYNAEKAEQDEHLRRAREANSEVRRIRNENHDPAKCQSARAQMTEMVRRDPIGARFEFDYTQAQQRESLYCGN